MKWENGRISPIFYTWHTLLPWSACEAGNGWASVTCPPILSLDISLLLDCFALGCEVCSDMCSGGGVMWEVCICVCVCVIYICSVLLTFCECYVNGYKFCSKPSVAGCYCWAGDLLSKPFAYLSSILSSIISVHPLSPVFFHLDMKREDVVE